MPEKENTWSSKVIIPSIAILALAIAAGMSDGIKAWFSNFLSSTKEYTVECTILNAGLGVSKALIIVDKTDSLWTDTKGVFYITKLKKGKHFYSVIFRNADYPYNIFVSGDSLLIKQTRDLSSGDIVKEATNKPIEPVEHIVQKNTETAIPVVPEKELLITDKTPDNKAAVNPPIVEKETPNVAANLAGSMSAEQILQKLQLRVYKDPNDLLSEDQIAYHYYLQGENQFLDRIVKVSYRRNHRTFDEFKYNQVLESSNRSTKFDIKGYQWGFISTTYVSILLDDGTYTDLNLKSIAYDN